jgi:hypothetical protein
VRGLGIAFALALVFLSSVLCRPSAASQSTLVTPGAPLPMTALAAFLNSAFLSIGSCNSGPSAPANGPGAAAFPGECWADTSGVIWKFYVTPDGSTWVQFGALDTVANKWTPYFGGSPIATTSPVTWSVSAGQVTISCPTCLTAQNAPLGLKLGGLAPAPGGLIYSGAFGPLSMPTPFGVGHVPLSNGPNKPSWSNFTLPQNVPAGSILYAPLPNVVTATPLSSLPAGITSVNIINGTGLTETGTCNSTTSIGCTLAIDKATAANFEAGAASKVLTADNVFIAETTTSWAATITFDFSTFINTAVTMTGTSTNISCSNQKAGQAGTIRFIQDGTGNRALPATFGCNFKFAGGVQPVLSTAAGAVDALVYHCISASYCVASLIKNVQ